MNGIGCPERAQRVLIGRVEVDVRRPDAADLTIETFGGHSYEELVTPDGRQKAKDELAEKLKHAYHEEVEGVYFTEFVMQ